MHKLHITFTIVGVLLCTFSATALIHAPTVYAQNDTGSANITVGSPQNSSIAYQLAERVRTSWPWYVTRASGLVAAIVLVILMLSGIGFITGHTFSFLEPITAWATHRALGIIFGISILLHVFALYFDTFVPFSIKDILIPFVSSYRPVQILGISIGSLYVALGILALYITMAIILTSLFWIDNKPKTWKVTHILSYVVMVFVFVHALYLGTDLAGGSLRFVWIGLGILITLASLVRLWRAKTV